MSIVFFHNIGNSLPFFSKVMSENKIKKYIDKYLKYVNIL